MSKRDNLGFRGIFNSYTVKRNIVSVQSIVLAIVSLGICVWLFITKDSGFIYALLGKMAGVFVNSVPDLLGFCIGGYAIIVAINGLEKIPAILKPQPDKGMSYYQTLSADFAMTLVVMCALLLVSYVTSLMVDLELMSVNDVVGKCANLILIAFLLWTGALTVIMLMATVANLFSTSIILLTAATIASNTKEAEENNDSELTVYKIDTLFGPFTVTRFEKKHR